MSKKIDFNLHFLGIIFMVPDPNFLPIRIQNTGVPSVYTAGTLSTGVRDTLSANSSPPQM